MFQEGIWRDGWLCMTNWRNALHGWDWCWPRKQPDMNSEAPYTVRSGISYTTKNQKYPVSGLRLPETQVHQVQIQFWILNAVPGSQNCYNPDRVVLDWIHTSEDTYHSFHCNSKIIRAWKTVLWAAYWQASKHDVCDMTQRKEHSRNEWDYENRRIPVWVMMLTNHEWSKTASYASCLDACLDAAGVRPPYPCTPVATTPVRSQTLRLHY
jgi:hypothetical protein